MKTIKHFSNFSITIKKSKFIGFAYPIQSEADAKNKIMDIKKKYADAKHVVYAYKIGENIIKKENSSEPAGTAGTPILCAIENNELTNVLIIVVRYFGGILLGSSNLYRAYSDTAINTIKSNEVICLNKYKQYRIEATYFDYAKLNSLSSKSNDIKIIDGDFSETITINIAVKEDTLNEFLKSIILNNKCIGELWL